MTRYQVHAHGFPKHIIKATDADTARARYARLYPKAKEVSCIDIGGLVGQRVSTETAIMNLLPAGKRETTKSLSEKLCMSRSGIWKALKVLLDDGAIRRLHVDEFGRDYVYEVVS